MRRMFLSITGLLQALSDDAIDARDLDDSLFFIIGRREDLMDPSNADQRNEVHAYFRNNPLRGEAVRRVLAKAVEKAEIDGRVAYTNPTNADVSASQYVSYCWDELDLFLLGNGYAATDVDCGFVFDRFNDIRIDAAFKLSDIDLKVVA